MSNYTVQKGDTLWAIAKKQCGLTSNTDIANKVKEIANKNHIRNMNSIFAGESLDLSDSFSSKTTTNPVTQNSGKTDTSTNSSTSSTTQTSGQNNTENMGTKFDDWAINSVVEDQKNQEAAMAEVGDFAKAHPKKEDEALKDANVQEAIKKNEEKQANMPSFTFVTGDLTKPNAAETYKQGLSKLSKDTIKNTPNLDGDANTVNFEEFWKKEQDDTVKTLTKVQGQSATLDEESLKKMKETAKVAFKNMDLNGDGVISEDEQSATYATMDQDEKGNMNGKFSVKEYFGFTAALSDDKYSDAIKKKIQTTHKFLFGDAK